MAVAITADEQDSWPPRVLVSVTGLTIGDVVTIYRRTPDGEFTAVRGAVDVEVADTSLVRVDAELPFGTTLSYVAIVNDTDRYDSSTLNVTLTGGKAALSDAITGDAAEVVITAWPEKRYERSASTFRVGGRNVVVLGRRPGFTGTIEISIETDAARQNVNDLLEGATAGTLQLRQPGPYGGVDSYIVVVADTEMRWSQDGTDERRRWALDVLEVEPWAADIEAAGYTLQDIADAYDTPLTLDDLSGDYATLLDIAQGEFT